MTARACRTRTRVAQALRAAGLIGRGTSRIESHRRALALMLALDASGYIVMPHEPGPRLLAAADRAMRETGYLKGTPAERQRAKHAIRFRAMVEEERRRSGLAQLAPRGASTVTTADLDDATDAEEAADA